MDVQIMGGIFNYFISSGTYYLGTHLDFSISTFCIIHSQFCNLTINTQL